MPYDPDRYPRQREKALENGKPRVSFFTIATIVAISLLVVLSVAVIPKAIELFQSRFLDVAIYKLTDSRLQEGGLAEKLGRQEGVRAVWVDADDSRIVITYHRELTNPGQFGVFFDMHGMSPVLLDRLGHSEHRQIMEEGDLASL